MDLTRRHLLLGLAAAPFVINSVWAAAPKRPDVVIIGAGAADLGAAKTLTDLDISFLLIEAQSRIGGTCRRQSRCGLGVERICQSIWQ